MARIIAIVSGKGGVGKTTVALNLGTVLAHNLKKSVTLIDCNVTTSHLGMYLGMYYSPITLNKVLRGEVPIKDATYQHVGGMKVVPASLSLSDLEGVDITKLREKIELISGENDIILLDGAPGLGRESVATLKAADEVLFVTNPYVPAVMDIVRTMEVVNEIGAKPIGIVLNMVNKEKYEMTPQEIEQLTRIPVVASIPFDKAVNKSLVEKLPVVIFKKDSKSSKAFIELGERLSGHHYEKKPGFFARLFGGFKRTKNIEMPSALLSPDTQHLPEQMLFSEKKFLTVTPNRFQPAVAKSTLGETPAGSPELPKPDMPMPEMPSPETMFDEEKD